MENLLPVEITLDIFSRLPAESVLQCRQVCKTWRTLLHNPCFASMHLRRALQPDKLGILYLHGEYDGYEKQLYYGDYDYDEKNCDEESLHKFRRIKHPPVNMQDHVVGSCNGLICFSISVEFINDSIYISNPITREYVNLPRHGNGVRMKSYLSFPIVYGFGYLPSTNEYKVVRIFFRRDLTRSVRSVQVYTLGGGSGWRDKGEIMFSFSGNCFLANGVLHWLDDEMKIMAFDLADESFHLLPSPPFIVSYEGSILLRVLGGKLYAVHRSPFESLDIWILKKKNSSIYDMKDNGQQSWNWDREFTISYECLVMPSYEPFAFTKSGEILLWYDFSHRYPDNHNHIFLYSYDFVTEELNDFVTDFQFLEAIPHVNSFVSLKALGEDVKILGSAEGFLVPEMLQPNREALAGNKKRRRCRACGGIGHNIRTCKRGAPNSPQAARGGVIQKS